MSKLVKTAKKYDAIVKRFIARRPKQGVLKWINKHPFYQRARWHLHEIYEDIIQLPHDNTVLDQGASDGIFCRLLIDEGFQATAVDRCKEFKKLWKLLDVPGIIGDCKTLDWWNGTEYNVIVATVWPTICGKKNRSCRKDKEKIDHLTKIKNNWLKILAPNGILYFDVKENRYQPKYVMKFFSDDFEVAKLKTRKTPRTILRCVKK